MLEDKSATLRPEAATFQRQAVTLKRSMWWRNMKPAAVRLPRPHVLGYVFLPMLANLATGQGGSGEGGGEAGGGGGAPRLRRAASG